MNKEAIIEFLFNKHKYKKTKTKYGIIFLVLVVIVNIELALNVNEQSIINNKSYIDFIIIPFFVLLLTHRLVKIFWYNPRVNKKSSVMDIVSLILLIPFVIFLITSVA